MASRKTGLTAQRLPLGEISNLRSGLDLGGDATTSRPVVIAPLVSALFAVIAFGVCALIAGPVLAPRLMPALDGMAPISLLPSPLASATSASRLDLSFAAVAPASPLNPTVVVQSRLDEGWTTLEADDFVCRVEAQNSVNSPADIKAPETNMAAGSAAVGEALQAHYNLVYARCMVARGYRIAGPALPKTEAGVVAPQSHQATITAPPFPSTVANMLPPGPFLVP